MSCRLNQKSESSLNTLARGQVFSRAFAAAERVDMTKVTEPNSFIDYAALLYMAYPATRYAGAGVSWLTRRCVASPWCRNGAVRAFQSAGQWTSGYLNQIGLSVMARTPAPIARAARFLAPSQLSSAGLALGLAYYHEGGSANADSFDFFMDHPGLASLGGVVLFALARVGLRNQRGFTQASLGFLYHSFLSWAQWQRMEQTDELAETKRKWAEAAAEAKPALYARAQELYRGLGALRGEFFLFVGWGTLVGLAEASRVQWLQDLGRAGCTIDDFMPALFRRFIEK